MRVDDFLSADHVRDAIRELANKCKMPGDDGFCGACALAVEC